MFLLLSRRELAHVPSSATLPVSSGEDSEYYCLSCTRKEKPVLVATVDVGLSSGTKVRVPIPSLVTKLKQKSLKMLGQRNQVILFY